VPFGRIGIKVAQLFVFTFIFTLAQAVLAAQVPEAAPAEVPLTTTSSEARHLFVDGRHYREDWRLAEALQSWRAAARKDPNFAMAHLYVSLFTTDPGEAGEERSNAKRLMMTVTLGEQLTIEWLADAEEGNFLPAIAAMNDLLEMYPKDKWLLFQAGRWLVLQRRWDKGQALLERALAVDPDYTAALNQLGYLYASHGPQFDKAFKTFAHYAQVRPHEPNPQDSWAEVLRMSGDYQQALQHYHLALEIDPRFDASQRGIADTYAMIGDQVRARAEYEKAIQMTRNPHDQVVDREQSALTYVREGKYDLADQNYLKIAAQARDLQLGDLQADCYVAMAMYQPDVDKAMVLLAQAENIIQASRLTTAQDISMALSRVLYVRTWRAAGAERTGPAADAVARLDKLASQTGNNLIRQSYHGAAGLLALAQGKYDDAVAHLEEDDLATRLISKEQMALAYEKSGKAEEAARLREQLKHTNLAGIEQVVVVTPLRKSSASAAARSN